MLTGTSTTSFTSSSSSSPSLVRGGLLDARERAPRRPDTVPDPAQLLQQQALIVLLPRLLLLLRACQERVVEEELHRTSSCAAPRRASDCRLRPGDLRQRCRPRPWRWSRLCPWAGVHLELHLLLLLLAPRYHHNTSAVVTGRGEGSCDAQLLVSPPRRRAAPARSAMLMANRWCFTRGYTDKQRLSGNDCVVVAVAVVVVVVVRTGCMTNVFVDKRQRLHLIVGTVSLWTRTRAVYLCTGPLKIPASAYHRDDELPQEVPRLTEV